MEAFCDYCGKPAKLICNVCGSKICEKHKMSHGCKICGGGINKFD